MINIIVARDLNGAIGYKNQLLYRCAEDMKHFVDLTTENVVVMGRNTWESLPYKPLKNRINYIISRSLSEMSDGTMSFRNDFREALNEIEFYHPDKEVFIIGGQQLYTEALSIADRIYMTTYSTITCDYDTTFPISSIIDDFNVVESKNITAKVIKVESNTTINNCSVSFKVLDRVKK